MVMQKNQGESTPLFPREGRVTSAGGAHRATAAVAARRRLAGPTGALGLFALVIGIFVVTMGGVNNTTTRRVAVTPPLSEVVPPTTDVADSLPPVELAAAAAAAAAASTSTTTVVVTKETWECATSSEPVLNSTDVVAYFSLEEGEGAVYGTTEHELVYNGYLFRFASAGNKALFEESPLDYIPAWGGFCAYGIAWEDFWTEYNLGPPADPEWWTITDDNVLRLFRSEFPKTLFMEDVPSGINAGDKVWESWWGEDALPGADRTGTPMDTDCLCNVNICIDQ